MDSVVLHVLCSKENMYHSHHVPAPAKSDTHLYLQCTKHRSQLIHLNKVLLNNKTRVGQNHCLGQGTNRLGAKGKPLMRGKTI